MKKNNRKNNWKKLCLVLTALSVLLSALSLPAFAADAALDVTTLYKNKDVDDSWSLSDAQAIDLDALAQGETFTITEKGDYVLSGSLQGQVVVEVPEEDKVRLILNGVSITAQEGPAIYEKQADKLILTLAEGTENTLTDGTPVTDDDDTIGAALYAEDDLSVNGTGTLIVNGTQKHGIQSKADLVIANGQITVTSVLDGVRGRNSVLVLDGTLNITAGGDGVTSTRDDAEGKGWVVLAGGSVTVKTGEGAGAVQASANSQGGMGGRGRWDDWGGWGTSSDQTSDSVSQKAVKAATDLNVLGGTYSFDCADDGLHAVNVTVSGGTFAIQSGDDAMHADQDLTVNGGTIDVAKCYEGLEGQNVTVNGGDIRVVASDDGVNASGGSDGSGFGGWGRSGGNTEMDNGGMLTIAGGHLEVTAGGDGLDSNGSILISGGVTGVCTPSSGMEGPIDFNGTGTQTGGTLIIASGSGMGGGMGRMGGMGGMGASLSGQASMTLSCSGSAGETIVLQNESGETLGEFTPKSAYGSVTISSSSLQEGSGCTVLVSGKTLYSGAMQSTTAGTQNNGYGNWNNGNWNNGGGNGRGGQHGRRGW